MRTTPTTPNPQLSPRMQKLQAYYESHKTHRDNHKYSTQAPDHTDHAEPSQLWQFFTTATDYLSHAVSTAYTSISAYVPTCCDVTIVPDTTIITQNRVSQPVKKCESLYGDIGSDPEIESETELEIEPETEPEPVHVASGWYAWTMTAYAMVRVPQNRERIEAAVRSLVISHRDKRESLIKFSRDGHGSDETTVAEGLLVDVHALYTETEAGKHCYAQFESDYKKFGWLFIQSLGGVSLQISHLADKLDALVKTVDPKKIGVLLETAGDICRAIKNQKNTPEVARLFEAVTTIATAILKDPSKIARILDFSCHKLEPQALTPALLGIDRSCEIKLLTTTTHFLNTLYLEI